MARFETEEHFLTGDIYEVSKDDWSKRRRFTDRTEAEAYYEYLKREEVQDSIAKNQAASVAQNKEIIANQQRLLEMQERNSRMAERPQVPNVTRQILDPEYKEWLRFQKETSPEFKKWKKDQELAEAKRRAERAAEEQRVKEQELAEQRKKEQAKIAEQQKIAPLESKLLQGEKLSWQQRCEIAAITSNQTAIRKLSFDKARKVQDALLSNPNISSEVLARVQKKQSLKTEPSSYTSTQSKIEAKQELGCGKAIIMVLILIGAIVAIFNLIASLI